MPHLFTQQFAALTRGNIQAILRDRILHAVLGVAFCMLLLIPSLSTFSMRQVQELAITLSLSAISLSLLVMTLVLGSMSIWRDVERKYTASVLTLPVSRSTYVIAKFVGISLFLMLSGVILGVVAALVITSASLQYPSEIPLRWSNISVAVAACILKFIILATIALFLSSFSTSFSLPFFGTFGIYLSGSASQEVFEYVSGEFGRNIDQTSMLIVKAVYFLLPNFAAFDFGTHAVYALDLPSGLLVYAVAYASTYSGILLALAMWGFSRRQLP